jgi:hypothetical protein
MGESKERLASLKAHFDAIDDAKSSRSQFTLLLRNNLQNSTIGDDRGPSVQPWEALALGGTRGGSKALHDCMVAISMRARNKEAANAEKLRVPNVKNIFPNKAKISDRPIWRQDLLEENDKEEFGLYLAVAECMGTVCSFSHSVPQLSCGRGSLYAHLYPQGVPETRARNSCSQERAAGVIKPSFSSSISTRT